MDEERLPRGISMDERETVIQFGRTEDEMTIYTTDETMITKLEKLVEGGEYKIIEEHKLQNGRIIGKTYQANKGLLTLRSHKKDGQRRPMTEEEKKAFVERVTNARKKKS